MDFYKGYEGLIQFSAATVENAFGSQLLAICEKRFDTIEDAVAVLAEGLEELGFEVDEEGVVGLMTGEIIPSEDLVDAVVGLAETEAEEARLYDAAATAYEVAAARIEAGEVELEDEEEGEEDEEDYYYDDEEDYEDDEPTVPLNQEEKEDDEESQLVAEMYSRQLVTDRLNEFVEVADQMMQGGQGLMTPRIKQLLFGRSDKNRYMNFSAAVEESGYSPEEYLHCIEFSLNLLSELGNMDGRYFESQVDDEGSGSNVNFSKEESAVEAEARQMLEWLNL